jgi:hypothetical protein
MTSRARKVIEEALALPKEELRLVVAELQFPYLSDFAWL